VISIARQLAPSQPPWTTRNSAVKASACSCSSRRRDSRPESMLQTVHSRTHGDTAADCRVLVLSERSGPKPTGNPWKPRASRAGAGHESPCKSLQSTSVSSSTENRGVPGSSPGLATSEEPCKSRGSWVLRLQDSARTSCYAPPPRAGTISGPKPWLGEAPPPCSCSRASRTSRSNAVPCVRWMRCSSWAYTSSVIFESA
jgi:hypothetical protein